MLGNIFPLYFWNEREQAEYILRLKFGVIIISIEKGTRLVCCGLPILHKRGRMENVFEKFHSSYSQLLCFSFLAFSLSFRSAVARKLLQLTVVTKVELYYSLCF